MRVAAVQFRPGGRDKEAALAALAGLVDGVAPGADLVVLPELAATPYVFRPVEGVRAVAEAADGPTSRALSALARRHGCWLVAGFVERVGQRLYNSALVLDRSGALVFVYRKTLLYDEDLPWATPGDSGYATFDTGAGTFGVGICMDLNDDRFLSWVAGSGVRAVAFPTNWLEEGEDVWGYWATRMMGTRAALVAANTWGEEHGVRFSGRSVVLDGRMARAWAPPEGDGALVATLR